MNRLSTAQRVKILSLMVEGTSLRAITRITGCSINTVTKLLVDTGRACKAFHDEKMRGLQCKTVQVDEIWSFVYAKSKNLPEGKEGGSMWTFVAIDADTRLVPCWQNGSRTTPSMRRFLTDLSGRISTRFQLTSDGFGPYSENVEVILGDQVDFAQLVKLYGPEKKYDAKGPYVGADRKVKMGNPDKTKISTSYIERQNLTMRTSIKRFARETNAHSKKAENHEHALSLFYAYYNFVRVHSTLKQTPAMAAGISDRPLFLEDLALMA